MRRLLLLGVLLGAFFIAIPALAHEGHTQGAGPVLVVEIEGPIEQRLMDFVEAATRTPDVQLIVIRIDSPGVASGNFPSLVAAIRASVAPVVAWVGPQDAVAYGGAAQLLGFTDYAGAAPGARIGYILPTVAGEATGIAFMGTVGLSELGASRIEVSSNAASPDFLDIVTPSIGQFIAALDGLEIDGVHVETADQTTLVDGSVVNVPSVEVRFVKPRLFTRFLRLSIRPEAAFFFLVAGLALVAFEFYAAGVGVTAGVAAISLFLAAFGIAALPVRWWALAAAGAGVLLYTWDFQRNRLGLRTIVGTAALLAGGLGFTDAAPQFGPRWWVILIVVTGLALFYGFAMTTVVRSRFSTPTIGREHLIGRPGVAESDLDPDGIVSIGGATWRATAHRAAGIKNGDAVSVLGVKEIVLEVEPGEPPGRSIQ